LYGINRHGVYARGVIAEAVLNVSGMILVIPRYGIMGAALVSSGLMLLVRGVYTPLVVSRSLDFSFFEYMRRIYIRPILTGVPIGLAAWFLKTRWLPGSTWFDLLAATVFIGIGYTSLALFTCIEREHRSLLLSRIPFVGGRLAAAVAA